jgi:hypothetical protein
MGHVAWKLGSRAPGPVDQQRYRRLQIYSVITAQNDLYWMRTPPGSLLWPKLTPAGAIVDALRGLPQLEGKVRQRQSGKFDRGRRAEGRGF